VPCHGRGRRKHHKRHRCGATTASLLVLLLVEQAVVELVHRRLKVVAQQRAVLVEEVSHRAREGGVALAARGAVHVAYGEGVDVVEPLHGGGDLPLVVGVHTGGVLLESHQEHVLLHVRRVHGQHAHQYKVGERAQDQDRLGDWEWVQVIPDNGQTSQSDGQRADEQATVRQAVALRVLVLVDQHLLDSIIQGVLDSRTVPFVHLDDVLR